MFTKIAKNVLNFVEQTAAAASEKLEPTPAPVASPTPEKCEECHALLHGNLWCAHCGAAASI